MPTSANTPFNAGRDFRLLGRGQPRAGQNRDLSSQAGEQLRLFQADVTAAEDQHRPRQRLQFRRTVHTGRSVERVERAGAGAPVTATLDDGSRAAADQVVAAVGRRPRTDDIGAEAVGLQPGAHIDVDDQLRATGVPGGWLYAVGDVAGRHYLTHMGKYQARLAADHILDKQVEASADHHAITRVVFTDPQVAAVGYTEAQARDAGLGFRTMSYGTGNVAGAVALGEGVSGTSHLVIDEDQRTIVGATLAGPGVGELLHAATIAITDRVTLDQLWHAVPAFPHRQRSMAAATRNLRAVKARRCVPTLCRSPGAGWDTPTRGPQ